jgi:RNA polymerase sigma-70 factor (ECF subfamily)
MTSIEECGLVLSMEEVGSGIDLTALVETYSALLFRVAHSVLRSRAEAEDVVQDAFVRVVERRSSLPDVRDMRVWLIRITWNLAIDRRRRVRPEQMDEGFAESLVASSVPADQALDEAQRMKAVLRLRNWGQRRWRRFWEEASLLCGRCCSGHERGCESGSREEEGYEEEL